MGWVGPGIERFAYYHDFCLASLFNFALFQTRTMEQGTHC